MKDVFVSYASEDRAIAQRLAIGLEASGISVWWDRQIQVGSEWDKTIEEALTAAKCVVVLWTGHAKQSRWVRAEARAALKKVVPIMLEADSIPLAFTGIQSLQFLGWDGAAESKEFDILLGVIKAQLEGKPVSLPVEAATKASWIGKIAAVVGLKAAAGVVLAVLLMASSFWRIDADVIIQVKTGRIEFSVNPSGPEQIRLTDSLSFTKLSLEHVGQLFFSPDRLFVANPDELDLAKDTYPPKAWLELPGTGNGREWQFQTSQPGISPIVTFGPIVPPGPIVPLESSKQKESPTGELKGIILPQPTTVILERPNDSAVSVTIRTEKWRPYVDLSVFRKKVELVEEGLELDQAVNLPFSQDQELTYRAFFKNPSEPITVKGNDSTFIVVINPDMSTKGTLFSKSVLPLESVDFSWQDPKTGARLSHPHFQGTVQYRSLPDMPKVAFQSPMFLTVEELDQFEITGIRLDPDPDNQVLVVDMQGIAGKIKTGTGLNPRDLRPTVFDVIRFHPVLAPLRNLIGF
jgi:hypothetical protein